MTYEDFYQTVDAVFDEYLRKATVSQRRDFIEALVGELRNLDFDIEPDGGEFSHFGEDEEADEEELEF
jgi:hypothetical protein